MTTAYYSDTTKRVVGQLKKELGQGVLLHGPAGIGLKFAATDIARAHTKEIITIEPDAKGTISIDVIRELYTVGRSKGNTTIFLIDDADAMGREAQNALLKLLEEPIASLHFILTSHVPERLLETIRSRVAQYVLTPISTTQSAALLKELAVTDPTKLAQLLFIAEGMPAALTRYAERPKVFEARAVTVRDAREFLQGSREDRLILTSRYKDRLQALNLVRDMFKLLRRSVESNPRADSMNSFDELLAVETALIENASVRLSLTSLALAL